MRKIVLFLTTLLIFGTSPVSADQRLTKAFVKSFIQKIIAAQEARDIAAIMSTISPDAEITIKTCNQCNSVKISAQQYQKILQRSVDAGRYQNSKVSNISIQISSKGDSALVTDVTTESTLYNGKYISVSSNNATVIKLVNGKPLVVKMYSQLR